MKREMMDFKTQIERLYFVIRKKLTYFPLLQQNLVFGVGEQKIRDNYAIDRAVIERAIIASF